MLADNSESRSAPEIFGAVEPLRLVIQSRDDDDHDDNPEPKGKGIGRRFSSILRRSTRSTSDLTGIHEHDIASEYPNERKVIKNQKQRLQ
ncbi:hypothetical protein RHS01_01348 [Rhizoctonia solani]|uniref:Uncharacterized protein n=1 Tax=Rhizoctonia solani TaxID=456999 RepID=A0A8H7IM61_9AGAM|nr:hypothetical protein RHS01_01348 [Rhizoctonia solani]